MKMNLESILNLKNAVEKKMARHMTKQKNIGRILEKYLIMYNKK